MIALQSEANADTNRAEDSIELREWQAFGTVRAGHGLQLVRLACCLKQRSLAFNNVDVLALISATLWQCCPPMGMASKLAVSDGEDSYWVREAGALLLDRDFGLDLCELALDLLQSNRDNWERHVILVNVITIARTLLEHNADTGSVASAAANVLLEARQTALNWLRKLLAASNRCTHDQEAQRLRTKTLQVAAAATTTCDGGREREDKQIRTYHDPRR